MTVECLTASLTFSSPLTSRLYSSGLKLKWLLRLKSPSSASVHPQNARSTLTGLFNSLGMQVTFLDAGAN